MFIGKSIPGAQQFRTRPGMPEEMVHLNRLYQNLHDHGDGAKLPRSFQCSIRKRES